MSDNIDFKCEVADKEIIEEDKEFEDETPEETKSNKSFLRKVGFINIVVGLFLIVF